MKNHHVDLVISGTQADIELPYPVKYRFNGLGFIFGANGGIDLVETYKKNYIKRLFAEINSLPVEEVECGCEHVGFQLDDAMKGRVEVFGGDHFHRCPVKAHALGKRLQVQCGKVGVGIG